MNRSGGLRNKLIYLSIIVVMLLPTYFLGQPSTGKPDDSPGQLTVMRSELGLAESSFGEIDPASESMKLASLGLRGVAAMLLWRKSEEYKVRHEWDRLRATLNQIANLQPHYEEVWEYQAHNLSYNVSLEFDDYRQRYAWVKKGTEYLTEGVRKNRRAPRLIWYTGWFYGNKMGMSDEKVQFRELFRGDTPFHEQILEEGIAIDGPDAKGPDGRPDNWLVGRLWANRGYELVDSGVELVDKSPMTFYDLGPKWRINHADAIETIEGVLDDRAKSAWERAADDWYGYGLRPLATGSGMTIQLSSIGDLWARHSELTDEFNRVVEGSLEERRQELLNQLDPELRDALEKPEIDRSAEEQRLALEAETMIEPKLLDLARSAPPERRLRAVELVDQLNELNDRIALTENYRDTSNYGYWALRAQAEQDDVVIDARRLLREARDKYDETDLDGEIEKYEQAFVLWKEVFDTYPGMILDTSSDEVTDAINRYRVATDQSDLPPDFPLKIFYDMRNEAAFSTPEEYQRRVKKAGLPEFDISKSYSGGNTEGAPIGPMAPPPTSADPQQPKSGEGGEPEKQEDETSGEPETAGSGSADESSGSENEPASEAGSSSGDPANSGDGNSEEDGA